MSKQFIVDRHTTPGTPALDPVATAKVPVYDTAADADADLANLEVGQIIGIKDTGDELAQPVNVVEEGNLHAVSSNAVFKNCPRFPDYSQLLQLGITDVGYKVPEDCYVVFSYVTTASSINISLYIDGNDVLYVDSTSIGSTKIYTGSFCGYVKKGQIVRFKRDGSYLALGGIKFYKLSN